MKPGDAGLAPASGRGRALWVAVGLALAIATLLVYAPVRGFDYVSYDDPTYVADNPIVQRGLSLSGIAWAATTGSAANWHPLTWISLMADVSLFGARPAVFHVVNVLFHAANALLLFALLGRLTGALWRSACVGACFALHPLHVESVAWIAERKDVLSTCFGLLTLAAYAGWTRAPSVRRYALALALFALGLTSKPMLVSWPFVLLLFDYWPLQRSVALPWRRLLLEKLPFLALAAAASLVTLRVQSAGGTVRDTLTCPPLARVANAIVAWAEYAWKLLWPHPLAFFYPYPATIPVGKTLLCAVFLVVVTSWVWRLRARAPWALMGWLFYVATLVPVIGFVQVGGQRMADRYTYIPSMGIFIAVVWTLTAASHADSLPSPSRQPRVLAAWWSVVLALGCWTITTHVQLRYWQNSVTLFSHALEVTQGNYLAHNNLAVALALRGSLGAAEAQYREATRLVPDYVDAHTGLGVLLMRQGRYAEAREEEEAALGLLPTSPEVQFNLGALAARTGRLVEAEAYYAAALRLNPDMAVVHYNWGNLLAAASRWAEAEAHFSEAARLDPENADAWNTLGLAIGLQGRWAEALPALDRAVLLSPRLQRARLNLGRALGELGRQAEARAQWQAVLGLDPQSADAEEARKKLGP